MSRFESWAMHLASVLVGGTGLVYAWMLYLVRPADPYAVVNHPWQPHAQHLHILVAPLLVFAVGLVWQRHIWSHWRNGVRKGKRTGLSLALTLVPMVVSGYLIQTAVDESWRKAWVAVHLVASGLWLAGYLAHQVRALRAGIACQSAKLKAQPPDFAVRTKGEAMAGKFALKKAVNGQFYFNLQAGNGQVILTSEMYTEKRGATNGIESVRTNAPEDGRYERKESGKQFYFVLKASNGQTIGRSEMYNAAASMENGVESVKKNAPDAKVDDQAG